MTIPAFKPAYRMPGHGFSMPCGGDPSLPLLPKLHTNEMLWRLEPDERKALRQLTQDGDILEVDGVRYFLAPMHPTTERVLCDFEADREDLEHDDADEENGDLEPSLGWTIRGQCAGFDDREAGHTDPKWQHRKRLGRRQDP